MTQAMESRVLHQCGSLLRGWACARAAMVQAEMPGTILCSARIVNGLMRMPEPYWLLSMEHMMIYVAPLGAVLL